MTENEDRDYYDSEPVIKPKLRSLYHSEKAEIKFGKRNKDALQIGLNLSIDEDGWLYWGVPRQDGCYHCYNYTGKLRGEFEKEDVAGVLASILGVKLKKDVSPLEISTYNPDLLGDIFKHIRPRRARREAVQDSLEERV